ncbi:MAG: acyl-CoA thioesterase [Verrucomicrobia bacterium]|jgi:YbgC/YbaW family acyl-CoA thioester hydrolase|nr:acyl-CoA thioesterase [Verrucomicrobiota bacterium]
MDLSPPPLCLRRRVEFSQTDAAGLAHFSTFFFFMEAAEAELFRGLDLPLLQKGAEAATGFPRSDVQCRFRRPLAFGDLVETRLSLREVTTRRLHYGFLFLNEAGKRVATGTMTTVFARRERGGELAAADLPASWQELFAEWMKAAAIND